MTSQMLLVRHHRTLAWQLDFSVTFGLWSLKIFINKFNYIKQFILDLCSINRKKSYYHLIYVDDCDTTSRTKPDFDMFSDPRWVHHFKACSTASEVRLWVSLMCLWVSLMSMWVSLSLIWVNFKNCASVTLFWSWRSILLQRSDATVCTLISPMK